MNIYAKKCLKDLIILYIFKIFSSIWTTYSPYSIGCSTINEQLNGSVPIGTMYFYSCNAISICINFIIVYFAILFFINLYKLIKYYFKLKKKEDQSEN